MLQLFTKSLQIFHKKFAGFSHFVHIPYIIFIVFMSHSLDYRTSILVKFDNECDIFPHKKQ